MEFLRRFWFNPDREGTATSNSAGGLKMVLCDNKTMLALTIKVNSIFVSRIKSFLLIVHIFELIFVSYLSLAVTAVMDIQSYLLELGDHLGLGDARDSETMDKGKGCRNKKAFGQLGDLDEGILYACHGSLHYANRSQ